MKNVTRLSKLIFALKMADSVSQAKRLIEQGAVEIDGEKITTDKEVVWKNKDGDYEDFM